jgi:glycosyltransferase involved in cell wall biosynthesis
MNKRLVLFFTHDVCLNTWKTSGMLSREVRPYQELVRQGWDVSFVTYGGESDLSYSQELAPIKILPAYGARKPRSRLWRVVSSPFILWKHRVALKGADIYKSNQIWGAWNAVIATWVFGGKAIARGGYEYLAFSRAQKQKPYHQAIAWLVDWFAYRFADAIVLATEADKDFALRAFTFLEADNIDVQPNWIDTAVFKPLPKADECEADLIYIGRLNAQKNLPALIEAVKFADVSLDIYGDGELQGDLEDLVSSTQSRVRFMGRIANDEIPQAFCKYKAFILPSHFEGNPKVLLEAMACGMVVVGSDVPGIKEIIRDGENGILCRPDAQGLAEGIAHGLAAKSDLGKAARADIEKTYSFERFIADESDRLEALL